MLDSSDGQEHQHRNATATGLGLLPNCARHKALRDKFQHRLCFQRYKRPVGFHREVTSTLNIIAPHSDTRREELFSINSHHGFCCTESCHQELLVGSGPSGRWSCILPSVSTACYIYQNIKFSLLLHHFIPLDLDVNCN